MKITKIKFENFTAFENLIFTPSSGVNVLIGPNGVGKTHLMKVAYAACDVSKTKIGFGDKLIRVFLPSERELGRLVKRQQASSRCVIEVCRDKLKLRISFSNHTVVDSSARTTGADRWVGQQTECVYIPVKEMLANAPGFRSLYGQREVHFEEIYNDILDRAFRPVLRSPVDRNRKKLLGVLQEEIDGKVRAKGEDFFLRNKQGNLEFTLLAEGMRKLGLLWLLIQNGTLLDGSVLFWDEPETNLNPKLFGMLIEILLELQRMGVQIFLATHDYVILKELDLQAGCNDNVAFHSLYMDRDNDCIACDSVGQFLEIRPNLIVDTFGDIYDREVERSIRSLHQ